MLNVLKTCVGEGYFQTQMETLRTLQGEEDRPQAAETLAALLLEVQKLGVVQDGAGAELAELLELVADDPVLVVEDTQESELVFDVLEALCQEAGLMAFAEHDDEEGLAEMAVLAFIAQARGEEV